MKNQITDNESKKRKSKEAEKGFKKFIIGIIAYCLIAVLLRIGFIDNPENGIIVIGLEVVFIAIFVNNILGLINGIRSLILKENSIWMKYLGIVGNIVSILVIGILMVTNLLYVLQYLNC